MKRIGIFIYVAFGSGGMFQYSQQLLAALLALPRNKFGISVFYVDQAWASIVPEHVESVQLSFPRIVDNFLKLLFQVGAPDWVMRLAFRATSLSRIHRDQLDLVIFPSQDLAGIFVTSKAVNVVHDIMHRYEPQFKESSGMGRGKFRDKLFTAFCKHSTMVMVDSEVGKQQLIESYRADGDKVGVLPYIAPGHIVSYRDEPNLGYFNELKLPPKFIFYPAQFWPHKNHKVLVEAASLLRNEIPELQLIFIGPRRHSFKEIEESVKAQNLEGNITFLDYVPNEVLGGFYLRARAMIMPTFYGPTNIPPLEAIALGCPVAVSRIYGMPAQLGKAALYFNNRDAKEVAAVISQLWRDDETCAKLRENAKAHFAQWNEQKFNQRLFEIITPHLS